MPLNSVITAILLAFIPSKWVPLIISLSLRKRKTSHETRLGEWGGYSSTVTCLLAWNCQMLRVLGVGTLLWWSSHNFSCHSSSLLTHWAKHILQDLLINLLMDCLTLWPELTVNDVPLMKQSTWLCFFKLGKVGDIYWLLWCLVSRFDWKLHISSPVMTLQSKFSSVWRWLMFLQ